MFGPEMPDERRCRTRSEQCKNAEMTMIKRKKMSGRAVLTVVVTVKGLKLRQKRERERERGGEGEGKANVTQSDDLKQT
jgi:hypothetical protein